jgi:L-ascorbate 6-phosphate lactonase
MPLADTIQSYSVPSGSVAIWWLGQASFIVKSPDGITVMIDPYLTNSCRDHAAANGMNMDRRFPVLIEPGELKDAAVVLTHTHRDHCDQATIELYRKAGGTGPYVAPGETMEKLLGLGVPREEILLTWPNKEHRLGDLRLKATFAIPYWNDDLTHIGYLLFVDNGPTIYFTGDTDYHDILASVADHKPDVMVTVINGAFRNLGPNEAAKLTAKINPKLVIPSHYDLFPDNSLDPRLFRTCLHAAGIGDKYHPLTHGETFLFPGGSNSGE